ncbi:MAG TPA: glycosyl transferase family 1, partial [Sulfurimonas sp. UBA10385]
MKILYDYQIFSTQRYGGISRYFYELIKEFDSAQDIEIDTSLLISDNYYISDKKFVQYLNFLQDKDFYAKKRFMSFFNNI